MRSITNNILNRVETLNESVLNEAVNTKRKDNAYCVCYGRLDVFPSVKEALDFYKECAAWCEGAERERYMNIVLDLLDGQNVAYDGVDGDSIWSGEVTFKNGDKNTTVTVEGKPTASELIKKIEAGEIKPEQNITEGKTVPIHNEVSNEEIINMFRQMVIDNPNNEKAKEFLKKYDPEYTSEEEKPKQEVVGSKRTRNAKEFFFPNEEKKKLANIAKKGLEKPKKLKEAAMSAEEYDKQVAEWRANNKFVSNDPEECPVCGADLSLGVVCKPTSPKYHFDDDGWFSIDWKCKKCGATGSVVCTVAFWSQAVNTPIGVVEVSDEGVKPTSTWLNVEQGTIRQFRDAINDYKDK